MEANNMAAMREALFRCDAIAQLPETRELQSIKDMRNIIAAALAAPPRNCDILDWRKAWDLWITEKHPQKPQTFNEAYKGTVSFMDWYMSKSEKEGGNNGK